MKIRYFAWIRSRIGLAEEILAPPPEVARAGDLLAWLESRGENYRKALAARNLVKIAVNQEYVDFDHPLREGDEIALFPPVTGG